MDRPLHPGPRPPLAQGEIAEFWWCPVCGAPAHRIHRPGRPKVYCSNACRQRAYRWRRQRGIRLLVATHGPAERSLTRDRRHALRDRRDFVATVSDSRRREVAVCGVLARPARLNRYTHYDFLPTHPWSCRSCRGLIGADP